MKSRMGDELEKIFEEAGSTQSKYYPIIYSGRLRKIMKSIVMLAGVTAETRNEDLLINYFSALSHFFKW
jgi:hypothetical protein